MSTPQKFLAKAVGIDAAIQYTDRRLLWLRVHPESDPRWAARLLETRNQLVKSWGELWHTERVPE